MSFRITPSAVSVFGPGPVLVLKAGNGTLPGRAPVVKLTGSPLTVLSPVAVCENIVYAVLGYMPATSNVIVCTPSQGNAPVYVAGTLAFCGWKETRMLLP